MDRFDVFAKRVEDKRKQEEKADTERKELSKAFDKCFNNEFGLKILEYLKEYSGIEKGTIDLNPNVLIYQRGKIDFYLNIVKLTKGENNE